MDVALRLTKTDKTEGLRKDEDANGASSKLKNSKGADSLEHLD